MSVSSYTCLLCNSFPLEVSEVCQLKCGHVYCWVCIERHCCDDLKAKMKCPKKDCNSFINDAIIRKILPETKIGEYEQLCIPRDNVQLFTCLLQECGNVVFFHSKAVQFECQSCSLFNCISCNATHPFLSCDNYKLGKNKIDDIDGLKRLKIMEDNEMKRALQHFRQMKLRTWNESIHLLNINELVPNQEAFNCSICTRIVQKGDGVKLRKCFHQFCRSCLHDSVKNAENIPINCPENDCVSKLEDREIRGILTEEEYKIYSSKCNEIAKGKIANVFHCKHPDCTFFGIVDYSQYNNFRCPVCKCVNCLKCNTIHKNGELCEEYQDKIHHGENPDFRSLAYIEDEIKRGKCMKCPSCGAIIRKDGGCNWIQCPQCKLELCWILKIPRWGPKGRGDTSGGCRCGINNILCDPQCLLGCIPEH